METSVSNSMTYSVMVALLFAWMGMRTVFRAYRV